MTNPPPSSNIGPLIFKVLAGVGGPAIFGVAWQLTQNTWKALTIVLIYEVLVIITGFMSGVWKILQERWIMGVANWIDQRWQGMTSDFKKEYLQHIIYRHRDLDVKGLTTQGPYNLDLGQVFVQLSVAPQAIHESSSNPIRSQENELQKGLNPIWTYLSSNNSSQQKFVILGSPGSGKTTLLKHMALTLASGKKYRDHFNSPDKIPVLLFLRDHAELLSTNRDTTLVELISQSILRFGGINAPGNWFDRQLNKGRCLVMLDGLDEVADIEIRKIVVQWVDRQIILHGENIFIITSRPFGYRSNPLTGLTILEVAPFTSLQIQSFIRNWYRANEIKSSQKDDPGVRMKAREGANDLIERLRKNANLTDLAVNPLLLTMIATVHRYRSSLPGRRVELYAEICEVFLGKRQQARGVNIDMTPIQKQSVLQPLAYNMMLNHQREISELDACVLITENLASVSILTAPIDFLKMVENSSGLLIERENGIYSFAHLTFQEYLSALYIQENRIEAELIKYIEDSWWHETIRLYSAKSDASFIINACLVNEKPSISALTLAFECSEEARSITPLLRKKLESILIQGLEDVNLERRRIVAEARLSIRTRQMLPLEENNDIYIDDGYITHAEYQLFIDEQKSKGHYAQPDHWNEDRFAKGTASLPIVGIRSTDASHFFDWLNQHFPGEWVFRLPLRNEIAGFIKSKKSHEDVIEYCTVNDKIILFSEVDNIELKINPSLFEQFLEHDKLQINTIINSFGSDIINKIHSKSNSLNLDSYNHKHLRRYFSLIEKSVSNIVSSIRYYTENALSAKGNISKLKKPTPLLSDKERNLNLIRIDIRFISESINIPNLNKEIQELAGSLASIIDIELITIKHKYRNLFGDINEFKNTLIDISRSYRDKSILIRKSIDKFLNIDDIDDYRKVADDNLGIDFIVLVLSLMGLLSDFINDVRSVTENMTSLADLIDKSISINRGLLQKNDSIDSEIGKYSQKILTVMTTSLLFTGENLNIKEMSQETLNSFNGLDASIIAEKAQIIDNEIEEPLTSSLILCILYIFDRFPVNKSSDKDSQNIMWSQNFMSYSRIIILRIIMKMGLLYRDIEKSQISKRSDLQDCLYIYISLCTLNSRHDKSLKAFEGIRIMKERKKL